MTVKYTLLNRPRLGEDLVSPTKTNLGRPPRIACLLALAHRFDGMVRTGTVKDYAELARLGHVTRARVTQIMNLLNLAPEIQEYLLWLSSGCGCEVTERDLRRIAGEVRWDRQRDLFRQHKRAAEGNSGRQNRLGNESDP
jgi:hypothetical protein